MINNIKIEICIGNIDDALIASKYPIDRIELNSALELGGLSPSIETIRYLKDAIDVPLCCMCRCRGGDFNYTDLEFETMLKDAENMLQAGADGIVFGFLNKDRTLDLDKINTMSKLIRSYNKEAIFHKAFDEIDDILSAAQTLIYSDIDRILTSGKALYPDILKGCETIRDLNDKFADQIQFLPGGGVRVDNIIDVLNISGSNQIHMTSKKTNSQGYISLDEIQLQEFLDKLSQYKL